MDISTGLGLLAGAIVVLTMIFMGAICGCLSPIDGRHLTTLADNTAPRTLNGR
jgi:hypothetical protein